MHAIRNNTPVWIVTGYMDCQCQVMGREGVVVARVGDHYLVKNQRGEVETCELHEVIEQAKH